MRIDYKKRAEYVKEVQSRLGEQAADLENLSSWIDGCEIDSRDKADMMHIQELIDKASAAIAEAYCLLDWMPNEN